MKKAIELAREALELAHVPIGCAMYCNDKLLASAYNDSYSSTLHAEIQCLYQLDQLLIEKQSDLSDTTCYTTVEPCIMCAAALAKLKIKKVIFAAKNEKFGGIISLKGTKNLDLNWEQDKEYEEEAIDLLQQFFEHKNLKITQE